MIQVQHVSKRFGNFEVLKEIDLAFKPGTCVALIGPNGSGKTTSIAKVANYYKKEGKVVLLAAGDTFRSAASEQLEAWAQRMSMDVVRSAHNSDPSAVVFDALAAAKAARAF